MIQMLDIDRSQFNKMNNFELIIFDLGDTLIYFDGDWKSVLSKAHIELVKSLRRSNLYLPDEFLDHFQSEMDEYYRQREIEWIEYSIRFVLVETLWKYGISDAPEWVLTQAIADFHSITQSHWIPEADAIQVLSALRDRGYRLALISNASDDANTQFLIDKLGARSYFEFIVSSAELGIRKPDPKIFQHVLKSLGVAPDKTVMVGDTLGADILGANNVGIFSIWITRRADTPANRAQADTIFPDAKFHSLGDLLPFFDGKTRLYTKPTRQI
jgi:2-haloalkanoic acid dehalogenase type II